MIRRAMFGDRRGAKREMALFLGIRYNRYVNYENGYKISEDVENKILDRVPWLDRRARSFLIDQDTTSLSPTALEVLGLTPSIRQV